MSATTYTYTATDAAGQTAILTFRIEVTGVDNLDVNSDGQVTVIDLAIVALFYGNQAPVGINLPADVNTDGTSASACGNGYDTRNNCTVGKLSEPVQPGNVDPVSLVKGCRGDIEDLRYAWRIGS